jgi:hypothetical protein
MPKILFSLFCILLFLSCNEKGAKVVSVNKHTLYQSEIDAIDEKAKNDEEAKDQVIQDWIRSQLSMIFWDSLSINQQLAIEHKVAQYKADLIRFEWENNWINERVDTTVSEDEIKKHYEKHLNDFLLNDYIVKILYLKVPSLAPDIESVNSWFLLREGSDTSKITNYANQYGAAFYYNKDAWISFEEFLKELPIDIGSVERFVTAKTKKIFESNGYFYFINVLDFRLKNTPSPFSYEKDRIKTRIILNRKLELREKAMEQFELKMNNHDEIKYYNR